MKILETYVDKKLVGDKPMPLLHGNLLVDEDGEEIATLYSIMDGKLCPSTACKNALENEGYDTTWAYWDNDGTILIGEPW